MKIVQKREETDVAALREAWQQLEAQCPAATPFQTWEWNSVWWQHYGSRKRPRVLLFLEDGTDRLLGLAPLYTNFHLGVPVRRLAWMSTGVSDYLDLLALPEHAAEITNAFLSYLDLEMGAWDIADLQEIRADSPLMTHPSVGNAPVLTPDARRPTPNAPLVLPAEPCPYLLLPETWDELALGLGKKFRTNINYHERLLARTFEVQYCLADTYTLFEGMTALFDLHQQRWNARWLPGALGGRRVQAFQREVAARLLERGWLRLHLLRLDGIIRAALYCFCLNGRTFYYLGGFAPEFSKYSLGTLLTAHAIQQAIAEGNTEFDFLRGHEPYKYKWLPQERVNHRLLLLRSRDRLGSLGDLPGHAGLALNRLERFAIQKAKAFAEQRVQGNREQGTGNRKKNSPP